MSIKRQEGIKMNEKLIDEELYEFFIKNFPKCTNDLKEGIELLENVVQSSIDIIEEKSREIIKKERNFEKVNEYRINESKLNIISLKLVDIMDKLTLDSELEEGET